MRQKVLQKIRGVRCEAKINAETNGLYC